MRLTESLQQQLTDLELEQLQSAGVLVASDDGGRLTCRLAECENLACEVSELRLESQRLSQLTDQQIDEISTRLTGRMTYLLEPLSVIEADRLSSTVQIRSTKPTRSSHGSFYYEIIVEPGALCLRRFCHDKDEARNAVPFSLTREVLIRLAADMESTVEAVA